MDESKLTTDNLVTDGEEQCVGEGAPSEEECALAEERVRAFVEGLIGEMRLRCGAVVERQNENITVKITGEDAGSVIGYRGEVLDAVQYMALWIANKSVKEFIRVSLDAEGYRKKRTETLRSLAERLARKAVKTHRREALEPMNPYDRRIIHTALTDFNGVETVSEGEGHNRHVVIVPKDERVSERKSGITEVSEKNYGTSAKFRQKGARKGKSYGAPRRKPF